MLLSPVDCAVSGDMCEGNRETRGQMNKRNGWLSYGSVGGDIEGKY